MTEKFCGICQRYLSTSEFHIRRASVDGLASRCKSCQSTYDKARAHLPHRVKARLLYQQTEAYKIASARSRKRYVERHPEIRKAHIIVGNFLRDGKLTKAESCEGCGSSERLHAHHSDYSRPLDVVWLCHVCHVEWHRNNQPAYAPEVNHASGIIPCD